MTIAEEIHRRIMEEGGTLYHVGDRTWIVPVYGYGIGELRDERIRRDASAKFMREIASKDLVEMIRSNRDSFAGYCRSSRDKTKNTPN